MTAVTDRVLALLPNARLHSADAESEDVIIWGPPGTGKTTSLNLLLDAHLRAGWEPDKILVNAFTRSATQELQARLSDQYGISPQDMPWVRTIHSSCFRLLGLNTRQVVGPRQLREFGEETGFTLKGVLSQRSLDDPYGGQAVVTLGDWCYVAEELRRQRRQTVEQLVDGLHPPGLAATWDTQTAAEFSRVYAGWKREAGLWDFADMLERVLEHRLCPPVSQMFVDEAQDNTPLVWAVIDLWREQAERLFVFGDDDQALFEWSGADPKGLWSRRGHQFVLAHSYRLTERVHHAAQQIIRRTSERVAKDFEPDRPGGVVSRAFAWHEVDYSRPGSWLLLCRNRVFGEELRRTLIKDHVPFRDRTSEAGVPALDSLLGRAVDALWRLQQGQQVAKMRLRFLQSLLPAEMWPRPRIERDGALVDLAEMGASAKLLATIASQPFSLLEISRPGQDYLSAVLRSEGGLKEPRIEMATIHWAKGREADNVVVGTAMTNRTHEEYQLNPDAENRVYYVGATRARERLTWVMNGAKGYVI